MGLKFVSIDDAPAPDVDFRFQDRALAGYAGDTLAAALLRNDVCITRRSATQGTPRAPYCMMGVCYECMVDIDGAGAQRACQTMLRPGLAARVWHPGSGDAHEDAHE